MAGRHLALVGLWGAQVRTEIDGKPSTGIHQKLVLPSRWNEKSRKKEIISQKVGGEEVSSFSARRKQWEEHL